MTYEGSTAFTADSTPGGSTQVALYTGSARAVDVTLAFVLGCKAQLIYY